LPRHKAVSLRLTDKLRLFYFAAMPPLEAQPRLIMNHPSERRSLSAMCGGKAALRRFFRDFIPVGA